MAFKTCVSSSASLSLLDPIFLFSLTPDLFKDRYYCSNLSQFFDNGQHDFSGRPYGLFHLTVALSYGVLARFEFHHVLFPLSSLTAMRLTTGCLDEIGPQVKLTMGQKDGKKKQQQHPFGQAKCSSEGGAGRPSVSL